jgi:hypothetical protein
MFLDENEVVTSSVAVVPGANSYPRVGQTVDGKWEIIGSLRSPTEEEYHLRVKTLTRAASG